MADKIEYKSITPGHPDLVIISKNSKAHVLASEPYIKATRKQFKEMGIEFTDEFWDKFSIKEVK